MKIRLCEHCGEVMPFGRRGKYCSRAHKQAAYRKRHGKVLTPMERALSARRGVETKRLKIAYKTCLWCHEQFRVNAFDGAQRLYCNDAHKQAAYRERKKQESQRSAIA